MEKKIKGSNESLLSKEIFEKFFTKENISNFYVQFRVIFSWLALLWATQVFNNQINSAFDEVKYSTNKIINQYTSFNFNESQAQEIQKIFHKVKKDFWDWNIEDETFREKLYHEIKNYDKLNWTKLLQSLLLWFLYFFAYMKTINRVRNDFMKIDVQSFTTFSLTSWAMVFVNWLVPWSLVYAESFFLAWWAVLLHFRNFREWKTQENKFFNSFIDENPLPIVAYNKDWKPTLWNKKMEEETWYSYEEILNYYEKYWEVMTLLYKWENLKKVKQYLNQIKQTWEWYKDVAFTMTTKSWEEKTFLWTTLPDWLGWTIRTARHLTNLDEIKIKLEATEKMLVETQKKLDKSKENERIDPLTWSLNRRAFDQDMYNLITKVLRQKEPKKIFLCYIDVDNFRMFNEKFWHEGGDEALLKLTKSINTNIREWDKLYRVGWDEFILVIHFDEWDDVWKILERLDKIRRKIFLKDIDSKIEWVWTSWWIVPVNIQNYFNPNITLEDSNTLFNDFKNIADTYMYWVKDLKLIKEILLIRWIYIGQIPQKNAIAFPKYSATWEFIWIDIISDKWTIFITKEEFNQLKQNKGN